jgi:hypothetical protein
MICKIWGVHGSDYEECRLMGYKNPVRTSQETLRLRYRSQPVNALQDLRFSRQWLWRMSSSGYKNPIRTSQETHYVYATDHSQLMLCKIWGVHSDDYEECCLLGNKNPVRTSHDTHYVSAREPSWLMLCKMRFSWRWLWRMPSCGIRKPSSYLTGDTLRLCCRVQPVNAM